MRNGLLTFGRGRGGKSGERLLHSREFVRIVDKWTSELTEHRRDRKGIESNDAEDAQR